MNAPLRQVQEKVEEAAAELFEADRRIRSVGVTRRGSGFGFRAVRNSAAAEPCGASETLGEVLAVPVVYADTSNELESLLAVAAVGPARPASTSLVPEIQPLRPAVAGLQIQNYDHDDRFGILQMDLMIVGTLGCFVCLADGSPALLSNNHVAGGENRGLPGADRILQPGGAAFQVGDQIATLSAFVPLRISPLGASPLRGTVVFNEVDACVAGLTRGLSFTQGFLPTRKLPAPSGLATALPGDRVFKVGRTTGLTLGEVVDVSTVVGPVHYGPGPCWFRRSMVIEGVGGTLFSDKGDSGAAIVRADGAVVGLLYAGNGQQTYACPIDAVLAGLDCELI